MPDNIKYISKIHVGEEYYYIKDTSSVHETSVDSTPVFKDADGKYWNLSKTQQGAVTLSEYVYHAPESRFVPVIKWGTNNMSPESGNNIKTVTLSKEIDSLGTNSTYSDTVSGSIDANYVSTITSNATDFTSNINSETGYYDFSFTLQVSNDSTVQKTITCTGSENLPGTNTKESVTLTVKILLDSFKHYGYVFSTDSNAIHSAQTLYRFTFEDSNEQELNVTAIDNLNPHQLTVPSELSDVYLYIISTEEVSGHMFIMKADKSTIEGATTPSGAIKLAGTVQAYSAGKTYYVFRSTDTFNGNDTVSFKAN